MQHVEISRAERLAWRPGRRAAAALLALGLAVAFTIAWASRTWFAISIFHLPDNDDMMRLAEVRDWLGGQPLRDLMQYRLGVDGASMHWSRIADAGPAALILLFTPIFGRHGAELAMLVTYPGALFAVALWLGGVITARIEARARMLGVLVTALAFPASSLFVPGRIDHHCLQIVLTLALVERLIAPSGWRSGAAAGLLVAISMAIGLETIPFTLAAMTLLGLRYLIDGARERDSLIAFGAVLGAVTLVMLGTMRPLVWPTQWCDGFTPASTDATLIAALFFLALGASTYWHRTVDWRLRIGFAAVLGAVALPAVYSTASVCLTGPYGSLDPMLKDLWMSRVGEAQGIFNQSWPVNGLKFGGYGLAGAVGMAWLLRNGGWRSRVRQGLAVMIFIAALASIVQIRVDYVLSALVAAPMAVLIHRVRTTSERPLARVGIWLVGAGIAWSAYGMAIDAAIPRGYGGKLASPEAELCTAPDYFEELRKLPRGSRIIAPLDLGAYIIGGTDHRSLAAPYHRNNPSNLAMYKLFLGSPERAEGIARGWNADYIVFCPGSFAELDPLPDDRSLLIGRLRAGDPPAWLKRVPLNPHGPRVYRVLPPAAKPLPVTP